MRVTHISTYDIHGGAAKAAYRLHLGLRRLGHESSMSVKLRYSDDPNVIALKSSNKLLHRLQRLMRRSRIWCDMKPYIRRLAPTSEKFSDDRCECVTELIEQLPDNEIINLHWVADYLDYRSIAKLANCSVVVWTLHDMNPFTGGCHYDDGCGRYKTVCSRCPQLASESDHDLSHQIWKRKQAVIHAIPTGRLHVVTPSKWLAQEARDSALFAGLPITTIPYGIDTEAFAPRDQKFARETLGIPVGRFVILFVAQGINNRRKGLPILLQALSGLQGEKFMLLSVGQGKNDAALPIQHCHLGNIQNERLLSLVYSAADVFVIASIQDNLPNTVLESMACGTPVVGFDVGGIPDMVRNHITGMVVASNELGAFADEIIKLLKNDSARRAMSENCRKIAVLEYSLAIQARRYEELYRNLVAR